MISERLVKNLNRQMNRELYSAYFYLGMAAYAASIGLKGVEHWFIAQAKEEEAHAKRFYDYIIRSGGRVHLGAIEEPPQNFSSAIDLFEKTLAYEKKVTGLIHGLVAAAKDEDDKDTEGFLQWFVKEQVEEEATPNMILQDMRSALAKDGKEGLAVVDARLANRKL